MAERVSPEDFPRLLSRLDRIPFNTLFARTVLTGCMPGSVFADSASDPGSVLVRHPYGMSLLFGTRGNREFNSWLAGYMTDSRIGGQEWLQVHPLSWKPAIEQLLGAKLIPKPVPQDKPTAEQEVPGKVMEYSRVNFRFDRSLYRPVSGPAVPTSPEVFGSMPGQVVPRHFWRDYGHFARDGAGFTAMAGNKPAATAFAAFVHGSRLEIGIETVPEFRGKGYAAVACRALIDYCLARNLEPLWSCRLENAGSYNLAMKLGFRPTLYMPYYQLVRGQ
jgi:GNAT superfamily N-acetyltransferase